MELRIYGSSDDLIEFDGAITGEVSSYDALWQGTVVHEESGDSLLATAVYLSAGTWMVGVAPVDEDQPMPDWPIQIRGGNESESTYSATLIIDVPDGTVVRSADGTLVD